MANAQTRLITEWHDTPNSSNIVRFGLDFRDSDLLIVEFRTGAVYEYRGVPLQVTEEMILAPSVGKFLCERIKPVYGVRKLNDAEIDALQEISL